MFRPRVIPVLLLKKMGLVKSNRFSNYRYIGDPINAVKIFNDLKADELVFLDITASSEERLISVDFIRNIGEEANMPFSVGGGIRSISDIGRIIESGAERVIINTIAGENPNFIREASEMFGSSTIVVCIDVKRKLFGNNRTWIKGGRKLTKFNPIDFAKLMEDNGAGEIIVQSIERDGMMKGYDIDLIRSISNSVSIPIVALGGAGNLNHLKQAYNEGNASGLAAGSLFVYHGSTNGILINYPKRSELDF
jgi:imidazole glycerol-phosphate synthase subunit HisF